MNEVIKNKSINIAARLLMWVLIIVICYALRSIIIPILFSLIISVLLFPLSKKLENWGMNRAGSSFISLLLAVLILLSLGYVMVSQTVNIVNSITDIADKIDGLISGLLDWGASQFHTSKGELVSSIKKELSGSVSGIGKYAANALGSIGNSLSSVILIPIMVFFFLYYREFFRAFFFRAFASSPQEEIEKVLQKIYDVLRSYMVGLVTVMGIVAILNTIGLMILGIEYAWFFGILASLLTIFPYVGIFIGSLIPALFALATKDSAWYAVGVILWFQVVQTLEGNFITPKIVGGKASLNPLVSLLSFFLAGMLFGIAGMILALPLLAMLKVIFDTLPETRAYGFLLSEPDDSYILTERQKEKKKKAEQEKEKEES